MVGGSDLVLAGSTYTFTGGRQIVFHSMSTRATFSHDGRQRVELGGGGASENSDTHHASTIKLKGGSDKIGDLSCHRN